MGEQVQNKGPQLRKVEEAHAATGVARAAAKSSVQSLPASESNLRREVVELT